MNRYVIDIGATNTKFALMSPDGEIVLWDKVRTVYDSAEAYLSNLAGLIEKNRGQGDAVAVSTNGRMSSDGDSYRSYIPQILVGVNLREEMEKRCGLPVSVLNDGFAAALGEWWKGAGRGCGNMLAVVLGSGMGGGLILNGKLYQGRRLNAAFIFGMLKNYGAENSDITGLDTIFALLLSKFSAANQVPLDDSTGKLFFEYAARGDEMTALMLDKYCESVAALVYNSAVLLDLDCTVVTGGISAQDLLIDGINAKLAGIPARILRGEAGGLISAVVDMNDLKVQVRKGELALHANLYGALYYSLHRG